MTKPAPLKFATALLALGLVALMPVPLHAQEKKAKPSVKADLESADDDEEEEVEGEGKGLQIDKLLPLNKPNLRVKIPGFDKGVLTTMIEAAKLTRVDESNLKLEDAIIQMIKEEVTIKLRSALYNTEAAVLSSNEQTTVSSPQFTITGQTMDYDTKTGKGQMIGPNRTLIHNVGAMQGGKKEADEKKPKATPATPAPTTKKEQLK